MGRRKNYTVTGTVGNLRVREAPSFDAPVLALLPEGTKVTPVSIEDGWAKIEGGYLCARYLK